MKKQNPGGIPFPPGFLGSPLPQARSIDSRERAFRVLSPGATGSGATSSGATSCRSTVVALVAGAAAGRHRTAFRTWRTVLLALNGGSVDVALFHGDTRRGAIDLVSLQPQAHHLLGGLQSFRIAGVVFTVRDRTVGFAGVLAELEIHPAEDVIHHRFGDGNLGVAGEATGFEPGVTELVDQNFQF
jgi:hypothetical protein